jgi:hypothetical protein
MTLRIKEKVFSFIITLILSSFAVPVHAQLSGSGIFFQAIARDNYSNPARDRVIYIESRIIQTAPTGTVVFKESHQTLTDGAGVFSINIGNGTRIGGTATSLNNIDWVNGPFYLGLKISIQPVAPSANWDYTKEFIDLGVSPFGAVPYAMYAGNVGNKLNIADTTNMLAPYRQLLNSTVSNNNNNIPSNLTNVLDGKLNIADSVIKYVTPSQLKSKTFDTTFIYNQLATKANSVSVNNSLVTKEDLTNKSTSILIDGTSNTKYPSVKSVKDYVDGQITVGLASANIQDATTTTKGKIKLAGDLTGTADAPLIADGVITNAKLATGIDASKITGTFSGTATSAINATNATNATNAVYATTAGTASSSLTANTASTAITATYATSAGTASSSITANTASTAITATYATTAGTASTSVTANTASTAITATYATTAGAAQTATSATTASTATSATTATTAGNITATSNTSLTSLSNLNTVGTITTGTWSASTIDITKGGTGATTKVAAFNALSPLTTTGDILYASGTNTANRLPIGTAGYVLTSSAGLPVWAASVNGTLSLGAFSSSPSSNGATLTVNGTTSTLNLNQADANNPGILSAGAQYIGGAKTFMNDLTINGVKVGASNYVSGGNTVLGSSALNNINAGAYDIGIGPSAGYSNTSGSFNIAIGANALYNNSTGTTNTAIGTYALNAVSNTSGNTAVGASSASFSTGSYNTSIGSNSFSNLTSGNYNVAVGSTVASSPITSTQSIFIGYGANSATNNSTNEIAIGYSTTGLGSNTTAIGNLSTNTARIYGDLLLSSNNGTISDVGNYPLQVVGNTLTSGSASANTFISTVATGTAPFTVASTTPVPNLNIGGTATALSTATNYVQSTGPNPINVSTGTSFPSIVLNAIINTNGRPVQITAYGDVKVQYANEYCSIRLYRDNTAIGSEVVIKNLTTDGASAPFSLSYIDNPTTGSYTYYLKVTSAGGPAGSLSFGATSAPTITLLELR